MSSRLRHKSECSESSDTSNASTNSKNTKRPRQHTEEQKESQPKKGKMVLTWEQKIDELLKAKDDNQAKLDEIPIMSANLSNLSAQLGSLVIEVDKLKEKQTQVEQVIPQIYQSLGTLTNTQTQLGNHLNQLEQTSLANHFVIHNLPPAHGKSDAIKLMSTIGEYLELHLEANDFSVGPYFTQQKKNRPSSSLIGAFYDIRKKKQLFEKFKLKTNPGDPSQRRPILTDDIFNGLPNDSTFRGSEIVLKNLLTRLNRNLLHHAQQELKFSNKFKYVWESDGRILARRDEKTRIIEIRSTQDLQNIIKQHSEQPRSDRRNGPSTSTQSIQNQMDLGAQ